ncbi:hypothetical protein KIT04_046 [Vibrio phage KIT04]|nr:hypothetical protein KIT04_046 [Vibrio phage KIT04]
MLKTRIQWGTILGLVGFAITGSIPVGIICIIIGVLLP